MTTTPASPFLSRVMWADAASCAATGALQLMFTEALARLTGLPAPLLAGTGIFLVAYAALAAALARHAAPPRRLIGLVALGNVGWAIGCVVLAAAPLPALSVPSGWGIAWLLAQAACVIVLAELQWIALRRSRAAPRTLAGA